MDPELLAAVKALVAQGGAAGGTGSLVVIGLVVLVGLVMWAERRIRPPVVDACESLKRREREQSVTLRLLAGKAGISREEIERAISDNVLRERALEPSTAFVSFGSTPGRWILNGSAPAPSPAPPSSAPSPGGAS